MLDDLLHHLLTEMAMDGEEGCSVARIDGFIESFYSRRRSHYPSEPAQLIDASYKNFVWKILCELDQVRLGVLETKSKNNENGEDIIPEVVKDTGPAEFTPPNPDHFEMKVKTLELPFVATSAENVMTQRPTRLSKSNRRRPSEKPPSLEPSDFAIRKPILSIGQVRALETGKVTKDLTASASELTLSKRVRGIANPPTASATSTWRELSPDLCCLSRDDLISRFGFDEDGESRLKIAVDPMTCWKAVVGTDTRSPRMTAYVYQVLCIVAQGREAGATVIELGKKLKHDQKSLFHFVKVLIDLQLVVKFRAHQHKAWTNRVVHRRYLNTSEWYKISVKKDDPPVASTSQPDTLQLTCEPAGTTQPPPSDLSENYHVGSSTMDTIINSIENDDQAKTFMSPITEEHIAVNEALIRSRMFTVLKESPRRAMVHADIIKAIGIAKPTKDARRRLTRHIETYVKRGLLEKVMIFDMNGHAPCIRLTDLGEASMKIKTPNRHELMLPNSQSELDEQLCLLPFTRSIGQTIFSIVQQSGQGGIIYKDLCSRLNDIEVRTAEQILTKLEREQPPSHLSDLKVASVLESSGREKRVRWFSAEGLKLRCKAADIPLPNGFTDMQSDDMGGFMKIDSSCIDRTFYQNASQLHGIFVAQPKANWGGSTKRSAPSSGIHGRPRKYPRSSTTVEKKLKNKELEGVEPGIDKKACAVNHESLDAIPSNFLDSGRNTPNPSELTLPLPPATPTTAFNKRDAESPELPEQAKRMRTELPTIPPTHSTQVLTLSEPVQPLLKPQAEDFPSCQNTNDVAVENNSAIPSSDEALNPVEDLAPPVIRIVRQNLTTLSREYHLLEAIKFAGGIVEKSHELSKAARDLVGGGNQGGISDLMDSRTLNIALHFLERRGEIKSTAVLLTDAVGAISHRKVLYLPDISLDGPEMTAWLENLKLRNKSHSKCTSNKSEDKVGTDATPRHITDNPNSNQSSMPNGLGIDDEALHIAFSNQWRCVAQLYGFVWGKVARAKALHLYLLNAFQTQSSPSPFKFFTSSSHRMFSSSLLLQELPVSLVVKLVPILSKNEEFEQFQATPRAMEASMGQAPLVIRRLMQVGHQFFRMKVYQIVETLCLLKLLVPLEKSDQPTDYYQTTSNGDTTYYMPCRMSLYVSLFSLANEAIVYKFSQTPPNLPPALAKWPLTNENDAQRFWVELKRASIPNPDAPPTQKDDDFTSTERVLQTPKIWHLLSDQSKWHDDIQLTPTQREYIVRFDAQQIDPPINIETDHETISRIAHILVTSPEAVQKALKESRNSIKLAKERRERRARIAAKKRCKQLKQVDPAELKTIQEEAARILSHKAKNALNQKEKDWSSIINRFKSRTGLSEIDQEILADLHTLFTTPNRGINATQLESELNEWFKRKEASKYQISDAVIECEQFVTQIDNKIGGFKRDLLPMLPSVKAKRIKILGAQSQSRDSKKGFERRVLPDKPKRHSVVAARAIRAQPDAIIGCRPAPLASSTGKRSRMEWNETLDEILRDMIAILRARAYATSAHVLPWPIALEVFKGSKVYMLKNRCLRLERDPVEKNYLNLLTEAWTQLYFEKRGKVPELADPLPTVPAELNGGLALDYLRANIDKSYLRSQATMIQKDEDNSEDLLPHTYAQLSSKYRVKRMTHARRSERWNDIYLPTNSTTREEALKNEALSASNCQLKIAKAKFLPHEVQRACEAIKILTSTPIKTYSATVAARVLSQYSNAILASATTHLCMSGILAIAGKLDYKKRLPGRSYRYTDKYISCPDTRVVQEAREQSLTRLRVMAESSLNSEFNWPLLAKDADNAALLHAYSRGQVSLKLNPKVNRNKLWNFSSFYKTRKYGDDCIENAVTIALGDSSVPSTSLPPNPLLNPLHLDMIDQTILQEGFDGVTPEHLTILLVNQMSEKHIGLGVEILTKANPPKVHWVCDEMKLLLISSEFLEHWAIRVYPKHTIDSNDSIQATESARPVTDGPKYLIPRLWHDLDGIVVQPMWKLSLNRVESLILQLPGLPYAELQRHVNFYLNPLELEDVMEELIQTGKVIGHSPDIEDQNFVHWIRGFSSKNHFWIRI